MNIFKFLIKNKINICYEKKKKKDNVGLLVVRHQAA